jgi:hypothetical protein
MTQLSLPKPEEKWTKGELNYAKAITKLSEYLNALEETDEVSFGMYEITYYRLREYKEFYGDVSWDAIQKEIVDDGELKQARADEQFKGYYKLRLEIDRLKVVGK